MRNWFSRRDFFRYSTVLGGDLCTSLAGAPLLSLDAVIGSPRLMAREDEEEEVLQIPVAAYRQRVVKVQAEIAKRNFDALVIVSILGWPSGWDSRYLAKQFPGIVVVSGTGDPTLVLSEPIPPRPRILDKGKRDTPETRHGLR